MKRFDVSLLCNYSDSNVKICMEKITDLEYYCYWINVIFKPIVPCDLESLTVELYESYKPKVTKFDCYEDAYVYFSELVKDTLKL